MLKYIGLMPNGKWVVFMKVRDEVQKVLDMLKKEGFNPVDAVFEGALGVKDSSTLGFLEQLDEKQMVSGVVRVIYTTDGDSVRFVEIPVGELPGGMPGGQGEPLIPQEPKKR
jgi:hypothetical protein